VKAIVGCGSVGACTSLDCHLGVGYDPPYICRFLVAKTGLLTGLEPLRLDDKPVVFSIDDKSETVDLGRIIMKSQ